MAALKREKRISGSEAINEIARKGRRSGNEAFVIYVLESKTAGSRSAIVVSKKVDKRAVVRNRLRRQITEILRENFAEIARPVDVVIYVRPKIKNFNFNQLRTSLKNVLASDSF